MPMETILITGSGSGLGKLTALTLAKLGKKGCYNETQFQADLLKADAEALESHWLLKNRYHRSADRKPGNGTLIF